MKIWTGTKKPKTCWRKPSKPARTSLSSVPTVFQADLTVIWSFTRFYCEISFGYFWIKLKFFEVFFRSHDVHLFSGRQGRSFRGPRGRSRHGSQQRSGGDRRERRGEERRRGESGERGPEPVLGTQQEGHPKCFKIMELCRMIV